MATVTSSVADICAGAKRAAKVLARVDTATKNAALEAIATALGERAEEILEANARDMQAGRESELSEALLDRLLLDGGRIEAIAKAVRQIVALGDPVGEVIDGHRLPNGLDVRKVRVPLGVVAVVYEARPNVTIDAAALCLKSGNAIVLRGSSSALHSNASLARIAGEAAVAGGLPEGCVSLVAGGGREELAELATRKGTVDLIIPRGGEGLKAALEAVATVPVIYAASGNCHVYVEGTADLDQAEAIVLNAKTQRPGVCNAAETLLIGEEIAAEFVPRIVGALLDAGVRVRGDERTRALAGEASGAGAAGAEQGGAGGQPAAGVEAADERDWGTEYLAMTLAVRVVGSTEEAIEHIGRYGSGHSEAIVTRDTASARAFQLGVDAACVYVNASTRFTDGGEFGMGAEIGNSTQKLHVRGPIGLRELCTFKYLVEGDGHVRG
jgi:glutamate-5-semialdehyde dehydrogenase